MEDKIKKLKIYEQMIDIINNKKKELDTKISIGKPNVTDYKQVMTGGNINNNINNINFKFKLTENNNVLSLMDASNLCYNTFINI